jgi:hypothetical protein
MFDLLMRAAEVVEVKAREMEKVEEGLVLLTQV